MERTIANPIPRPCSLVVKNRSNTRRSRCSFGRFLRDPHSILSLLTIASCISGSAYRIYRNAGNAASVRLLTTSLSVFGTRVIDLLFQGIELPGHQNRYFYEHTAWQASQSEAAIAGSVSPPLCVGGPRTGGGVGRGRVSGSNHRCIPAR